MKIEEDQQVVQELDEQNLETSFSPKILDHDIVRLSNNFIPKGLVPLEKLFDNNDVSKTPCFTHQKRKSKNVILGLWMM